MGFLTGRLPCKHYHIIIMFSKYYAKCHGNINQNVKKRLLLKHFQEHFPQNVYMILHAQCTMLFLYANNIFKSSENVFLMRFCDFIMIHFIQVSWTSNYLVGTLRKCLKTFFSEVFSNIFPTTPENQYQTLCNV